MEQRFNHIPMVMVRIDVYILTSGLNNDDHMKNLAKVFGVLRKSGLRVKLSKCSFMKDEVEYLGYNLNCNGSTPLEDKVEAIKEARYPTNTSELKAYLRLLNYYDQYIPNAATILDPLHRVTKRS